MQNIRPIEDDFIIIANVYFEASGHYIDMRTKTNMF